MHTIKASDYEKVYHAYLDAKAHPMMKNEETTILCTMSEYGELIDATSDEDVKGYALDCDGAKIWGECHTQSGNFEFVIWLKVTT